MNSLISVALFLFFERYFNFSGTICNSSEHEVGIKML